jgi:hypothetical protein
MSTQKKLALAALTFSAAFLVPLAAFAQERAGSNLFDVRAGAGVGSGLGMGVFVLVGALGRATSGLG